MPRSRAPGRAQRWAQRYEPTLDAKSILGVLALNLVSFATGTLLGLVRCLSLAESLSRGFDAWAAAIVLSYLYWLYWLRAKARSPGIAFKAVMALVLLLLHAAAFLVVASTGALLA